MWLYFASSVLMSSRHNSLPLFRSSAIGFDFAITGFLCSAHAAQILPLKLFNTGALTPTAVAISADGSRAAIGTDGHLTRVMDLNTGLPVFTFGGHTGSVDWVHFTPDGSKLVTA